MKASTLSDLQKELSTLPPKRVIEIATRLAKHKKENKELLTYLLFEAGNEEGYISGIKEETDQQFSEINKSNLYLSKKTLRKILRSINKYIKFSGDKTTEVELRLYYCKKLRESGIKFQNSQVLLNLYNNQVIKIESALSKLHEDVQFDYRKEVEEAQKGSERKKLFGVI
jgi:hypothetical protein